MNMNMNPNFERMIKRLTEEFGYVIVSDNDCTLLSYMEDDKKQNMPMHAEHHVDAPTLLDLEASLKKVVLNQMGRTAIMFVRTPKITTSLISGETTFSCNVCYTLFSEGATDFKINDPLFKGVFYGKSL